MQTVTSNDETKRFFESIRKSDSDAVFILLQGFQLVSVENLDTRLLREFDDRLLH